ncbi:MAG TPA: hypothetical protein VML75_17175 [Kofleriaceae bacterium]|nr:hypothetical protein [Kofleriaceae bacterium]
MNRITLPTAMFVALMVVMAPGCSKKNAAEAEPSVAAHDAGAMRDAANRGATMRDRASFLVQISLTAGERGRDSSATQTHVSIMDDRLFFTETPRGAFAGKRPRLNVAAALTAAERDDLEQALRDLGLLTIQTIKTTKEPRGPHSFASMTAKMRLNGKEHSFALSGVTAVPPAGATAFSETTGYRAVMRFLADVERLARTKQADLDDPL